MTEQPTERELKSLEELRAELIGRDVCFNARVVGQKTRLWLPKRISYTCIYCGKIEESELSFLDAYYYSPKHRSRRCGKCGHNNKKNAPMLETASESSDFSVLKLSNTLECFNKPTLNTDKPLTVFYRGTAPDATEVVVHGQVIGFDDNELVVVAEKIEPRESFSRNYKPTPEDLTAFAQQFGEDKLLPLKQIASDMVGRPLTQEAALVSLHSCSDALPDVDGDRTIRGVINGIIIGSTKSYKSELGKDLTYQRYQFGDFVEAEQASRAGLTYVVDADEKTIRWGALVLNDGGFVFLDGLDKLPVEEFGQLREVLEKGRVAPRKMVSGEARARTRVIAAMNPTNYSWVYRGSAITDSWTFKDKPSISRWDWVLVHARDDVSQELIANRTRQQRPMPDEIFKKHVYWAWSKRASDVVYCEGFADAVKRFAFGLETVYGFEDLPLCHSGIRDVVTRVAFSYAVLTHSTDELGEKIFLKPIHAAHAADFLKRCYDDLNLESMAEAARRKFELDPENAQMLAATIGENGLIILQALAERPRNSTELAAILKRSDVSIRNLCGELKADDLITAAEGKGGGYRLTEKGVAMVKTNVKLEPETVEKEPKLSEFAPQENPVTVKKNFTVQGQKTDTRNETVNENDTVEGKTEATVKEDNTVSSEEAKNDAQTVKKSNQLQGEF